jgi:hypothetical protein
MGRSQGLGPLPQHLVTLLLIILVLINDIIVIVVIIVVSATATATAGNRRQALSGKRGGLARGFCN